MKKITDILLAIVLAAFLPACKWDLPEVAPLDRPVEIGNHQIDRNQASISVSGIFHTFSNLKIIEHGHCWSPNNPPTINDFRTTLGDLDETDVEFLSEIDISIPQTNNIPKSYIEAGKQYYIRAYAISQSEEVFYSTAIPIYIGDIWFRHQPSGFIPTGRFGASTFTIDRSAGLVSGISPLFGAPFLLKDTWVFDPIANSWTDLEYPEGSPHPQGSFATGFSVETDSTAYFSGGASRIGNCCDNQIFQLKKGSNASWFWEELTVSQKVNWARAVSFRIGNELFTGTGVAEDDVHYNNYLWKFDPLTNPAEPFIKVSEGEHLKRKNGIGFGIGNYGYVGLGEDIGGNTKLDFWQFDPEREEEPKWRQMSSPVGARLGTQGIGFTDGNKGYVCLGKDHQGVGTRELWAYDPASDSWGRKQDFPGSHRNGAVVFVLEGRAYVGTGAGTSPSEYGYLDDWWIYIFDQE